MTTISKLDVIEHHLLASIQMIAVDVNPISIHVIVMACEEMISSFAEAKNVLLNFDYRVYIEDEFHQQYRALVRKPYNYFKHADRDADLAYDGPSLDDLSDANELMTMMNVIGYKELGGPPHAWVKMYTATRLMKNPHLFKKEFVETPAVKTALESLRSCSPHLANTVLRHMLFQDGVLPAVPHRS
jgi:hypothetical protein